ncbi:MAG: YggS family pyridoxal phosphate-dependent enzyme [Desulfobacterales bacterium]
MNKTSCDIAENVRAILNTMAETASRCGRDPRTVQLLAVSKTVSPDKIRSAASSGIEAFGENYIQEAMKKIEAIGNCGIRWHFIGRLQTNKAKYAVKFFDLIHSVDSFKLAYELDRQAGKINKIQPILIQVNLSSEASKGGVKKSDTLDLVRRTAELNHLSVKGLMTIPPFFNNPEKARPFFKALRALRDDIRRHAIYGAEMGVLSMGMSGDYTAAIEEGATLVRIGTSIFGKRA